jgi:2'-5' RNA ligase
MLIMAVHQVPSLTQDRYEEVVRRLTGIDRLESPSDLPFEGLLVHVAGRGKNGFCVVDVFESEEAVERFNEAMGSIPQEAGIEEPPDFFPAHTFIAE